MPVADATCPLLAMSGDFSRQAHPLALEGGEEVAGAVSIIPNHPMLRAFYLPTVSSLPVGMFWKKKETPEIMIKSIKAMSSSPTSPCASFMHVLLKSLGRRLHDWLVTSTCHPLRFACKAFSYDAIETQFPSLVTGAVPDSIRSSHGYTTFMCMASLRRSNSQRHCHPRHCLLPSDPFPS